MNAVYGSTGFWAWMRYWYIDSADCITLMLIDKGYYDYDYLKPDKQWVEIKESAKNEDELNARLLKMGFGSTKKSHLSMDVEEMQRIVMTDLSCKAGKRQGSY